MTLDRSVLAFAGIMTLLSVVLTQFVSPLFIWFTDLYRRQSVAVRVYRILPGRFGLSQIRHQAGLCFLTRKGTQPCVLRCWPSLRP